MKKKNQDDFSLIHYRGSFPEILRYQIVTKLWMFLLMYCVRFARGGLLWSRGRSALTSGDIPFLMRSYQGWILLFLGFGILIFYVVFDILAMIILSSYVLHGKPVRIRSIWLEAFRSLKHFKQPFGFLLLLYVAFLIPLAGVGLGISLTQKLYIPTFITDVIESNRLYHIIYSLGLLLILVVSVYYLFTFHCIVIGKMDASSARTHAGKMMKEHWKDFFKRYLRFLWRSLVLGLCIVVLLGLFLLIIAKLFNTAGEYQFRVFIVFSAFIVLTVVSVYSFLFTPFQFLELTKIYESYTEEDEGAAVYPKRPFHLFFAILLIISLGIIVPVSFVTADSFDKNFPIIGNAKVIAHRGGGNLGGENTVAGIERAIHAGANASEIDLQRTADGAYVAVHDDSLQRIANDSRKVIDITLNELKQLKVYDAYQYTEPESFATFDEMLEAAKDRIYLYVELKGKNADKQMADDLYEIVKQHDMLEQVTFICLNYPLIQYMEKTYPDSNTGYLCYASFGEVEYLDVDELILEEETATPDNIQRIQKTGKKVSVWTVNSSVSMLRFYARNVDSLITDEVDMCMDVKAILKEMTDNEYALDTDVLQRVILKTIFVWWP